jgi:hypothetical protein
LPLKKPKRHLGVTIEQITQLRHHLLDLTDSSTTTDTLMSQMWGTDAVLLRQEHLRIAQATG